LETELTHSDELEKLTRSFLISLTIILLIGIIMVFSSSYIYSKELFGSATHYLFRQVLYGSFGFLLMVVISKTKINFWIKYSYHIHICCSFLLILTFIPGIGVYLKGSYRWIDLRIFGAQPGELVKYSILLASVKYFDQFKVIDNKQRAIESLFLIFPLAIFLIQPDFGTFVICAILIFFVASISDFSKKYLYGSIAVAVLVSLPILFLESYRVKRLLAFLDPWAHPKSSGFQIIQSFLAFANGSFFGQGIGNSNEKLFYLPEAHNDFIFSVIGEELGFVGVFLIVLLFLSLIYFGFRIALKMHTKLLFMLVTAIVFNIGLQALLNMGVVLGLLPTKGMNLPFISYGGSSLIANLIGIGIVLSAIGKRDGATGYSEFNKVTQNDY
jgi:cell division protein FtsW